MNRRTTNGLATVGARRLEVDGSSLLEGPSLRPELDQRFCGRCGEPCIGYEAPVPEIDPPRLCGQCSIEKLRGLRLNLMLISVPLLALASIFVLMAVAAVWAAISLFHHSQDTGTIALLMGLLFGLLASFFWMRVQPLWTARREAREVAAAIREQIERHSPTANPPAD